MNITTTTPDAGQTEARSEQEIRDTARSVCADIGDAGAVGYLAREVNNWEHALCRIAMYLKQGNPTMAVTVLRTYGFDAHLGDIQRP